MHRVARIALYALIADLGVGAFIAFGLTGLAFLAHFPAGFLAWKLVVFSPPVFLARGVLNSGFDSMERIWGRWFPIREAIRMERRAASVIVGLLITALSLDILFNGPSFGWGIFIASGLSGVIAFLLAVRRLLRRHSPSNES